MVQAHKTKGTISRADARRPRWLHPRLTAACRANQSPPLGHRSGVDGGAPRSRNRAGTPRHSNSSPSCNQASALLDRRLPPAWYQSRDVRAALLPGQLRAPSIASLYLAHAGQRCLRAGGVSHAELSYVSLRFISLFPLAVETFSSSRLLCLGAGVASGSRRRGRLRATAESSLRRRVRISVGTSTPRSAAGAGADPRAPTPRGHTLMEL